METQDPQIDDLDSGKPKRSLRSLVQISIAMLLIVGGLEFAGNWYSSKATKLESQGLVTTAEVYKVTEDVLGVLLEKKRRSSASDARHRTIHYRFTTQQGVQVESSFNRETSAPPPVGTKMQMRYLPSDPSIHETAIGHTKVQTSALHWIAIFFLALWMITITCLVVSPWIPRKLSTREKRLRRTRELQQK